MIKITEVRMVWFGGDSIFKTYIYVFCELGPVKKTCTYTYVVGKGLSVQLIMSKYAGKDFRRDLLINTCGHNVLISMLVFAI